MTSREFQDRLSRRASRASVSRDPTLSKQVEAYFFLLSRWNRKINLTGLRLEKAPDEAIDRLILEPLIALRHFQVRAGTLVDIGSGNGSPALPIALALPEMTVILVEAKARKAAYLREAVRQLGIGNVLVETARFEELLTRPGLHEGADLVTVRAVRLEPRVLFTLQAFLKVGGELMLFRGPTGLDIPSALTPPLEWRATVPLLEATRSRLAIVGKTALPRNVPRGTTERRSPLREA